ncbi:MAG: Abi family protein [Patescibacteria group bacterium]|nr:Abi family protein [Patescibacteria group bacterium]
MTAVRDETMRSKELFVRHFRQTYGEYPDIPVWVATEVMSFGSLSRMLQGMVKNDQKMISNRFQLQPHILCTWMHHLVYIRNLCAHHARLWDRIWTIKPERPAGKDWQPPYLPSNSRLFATLLILRHLMKRIPAVGQFASQWQARVARHLDTPPAVSRWRDLMGLTADWSAHPAWQ